MNTIFQNIKLLQQKIHRGTEKYNFHAAAKPDQLSVIEKAYHLKFPESYQQFLLIANGGMITEFHWSHYVDMLDDEPDGPKYSSFYLFSLDDLEDNYRDIDLDDWMMYEGFKGINPIIPIGKTPDQDLIFIISARGCSEESPVFVAFDYNDIDRCEQVSPNFHTFIGEYVKCEGFPKIQPSIKLNEYFQKFKILQIAVEEIPPIEIVEKAEALMTLFPDDGWNYLERANALMNMGERKRALEDYNTAIKLDNQEPLFYYCRGDLLFNFGSKRKALIDMDTAVNLDPHDNLYLNGRADVLFKLGYLQKALNDCNEVLSHDGINQSALFTRTKIYRALGDDEKADADSNLLDDLDL